MMESRIVNVTEALPDDIVESFGNFFIQTTLEEYLCNYLHSLSLYLPDCYYDWLYEHVGDICATVDDMEQTLDDITSFETMCFLWATKASPLLRFSIVYGRLIDATKVRGTKDSIVFSFELDFDDYVKGMSTQSIPTPTLVRPPRKLFIGPSLDVKKLITLPNLRW